MLKVLSCWILLLVRVFMPAVAGAEEVYPGKWWHIPQVAEKLKLNETQKHELDGLFMDNRGKLVELKSALERERAELDRILEKELLNEAEVMAQLKKLEEARTNMAAERLRFTLEVRKILGYQKFQSLKGLFKDFKDKGPPAVPKKESGLRFQRPSSSGSFAGLG